MGIAGASSLWALASQIPLRDSCGSPEQSEEPDSLSSHRSPPNGSLQKTYSGAVIACGMGNLMAIKNSLRDGEVLEMSSAFGRLPAEGRDLSGHFSAGPRESQNAFRFEGMVRDGARRGSLHKTLDAIGFFWRCEEDSPEDQLGSGLFGRHG